MIRNFLPSRAPVPRGTHKLPRLPQAERNRLQAEAAAARVREAEAVHAPCVICTAAVLHRPHEALPRYAERATCGDRDCFKAYQSQVSGRPLSENVPYTPLYRKGELVSVDYGQGFGGAQTVNVRPLLRRIPGTEDDRSYASASTGWLL